MADDIQPIRTVEFGGNKFLGTRPDVISVGGNTSDKIGANLDNSQPLSPKDVATAQAIEQVRGAIRVLAKTYSPRSQRDIEDLAA